MKTIITEILEREKKLLKALKEFENGILLSNYSDTFYHSHGYLIGALEERIDYKTVLEGDWMVICDFENHISLFAKQTEILIALVGGHIDILMESNHSSNSVKTFKEYGESIISACELYEDLNEHLNMLIGD